jgi:hypothetical protein
VRLFTSPTHAAVQHFFRSVGLGERYDYWKKELVRINEEEAIRAGRPPYPLWDFGDVNTVTREPIPAAKAAAPMRWYWDYAHYTRAAGALILDRLLDMSSSSSDLPDDFGVRLTGENVTSHLIRTKGELDDWAAKNSELATLSKHAMSRTNQAEASCW